MIDLILYFVISFNIFLSAVSESYISGVNRNDFAQDENSSLISILNGRIWRNEYSRIKGNQFFLTDEYLNGEVTFDGKVYKDLKLRYDILNDELILWIERHPVIFMNKEMVENFTLHYSGKDYYFFNAGNDSTKILKGYINVACAGNTSLYLKHGKTIQPLAVDGKYDLFYDQYRVFLKMGEEIVAVNSRKNFYKLLEDRESELKTYIKSNKIKVSFKDPNSLIPVIDYYNKPSDL